MQVLTDTEVARVAGGALGGDTIRRTDPQPQPWINVEPEPEPWIVTRPILVTHP